MQLTEKEIATNLETIKHINMVSQLIHKIIVLLLDRSLNHDQSKLSHPEVGVFAQYIDKLSTLKYGSNEYYQCKSLMTTALDHHYANNRHHPEHFPNGVDDMNIVDIIEMLCDWKAASCRGLDGNIKESIDINSKRFNISPQLTQIFRNSLNLFNS